MVRKKYLHELFCSARYMGNYNKIFYSDVYTLAREPVRVLWSRGSALQKLKIKLLILMGGIIEENCFYYIGD